MLDPAIACSLQLSSPSANVTFPSNLPLVAADSEVQPATLSALSDAPSTSAFFDLLCYRRAYHRIVFELKLQNRLENVFRKEERGNTVAYL